MPRWMIAVLAFWPVAARAEWSPTAEPGAPSGDLSSSGLADPTPLADSLPSNEVQRQDPVAFGLRGALTSGVGAAGVGVALTVEADLWLGDVVGLGARAGGAYGTEVLGDQSSLLFASPMLLVRAGSPRAYLRVGVGLGAGHAWHRYDQFCLWDCVAPVAHERDAAVLSLDLAMLWHPGGVELGPTLSLDAADGDVYVLGGLAIGGSVSARR